MAMTMKVSGIALRPLSGAGFRREADTHFADSSGSAVSGVGSRPSCKLSVAGFARGSCVLSRSRRFARVCRFSDDGHSQYYAYAVVSPTCGGKKEKEKEKCSEAKEIKKRMKLIKGLSKDLSAFNGMGFGIETGEGLMREVKGKMISEAAEVLLAQLQLLRAEEKELKRKRKEEKAARKAVARMKNMADSSSSSDSSDSDCGEVVDMSHLRSAAVPVPETEQPEAFVVDPAPTVPQASTQEVKIPEKAESAGFLPSPCGNDYRSCCRNTNSVAVSTSAERIEVCMGGKCKRSGAIELLAEFEKMVGIEGAVVACKCMGKCREGPNVRVLNGGKSPARAASNPLCLGVRLDDVGTIVANFFGEKKDSGLVVV